MDRVVLLTLLGIPVLVIMHVALFAQPIPSVPTMLVDGERERPVLQGHWQMSEPPGPVHLATKHLSEQGS
jgi:hypothetical protein